MKKTVSINLGGILFNIDEDAYSVLKDYLDKIRSFYKKEPGSEEILNDIESRIAELLQENMGSNKQVVSIRDIEEVIKVMGEPYQFDEYDEKKEKRNQSPGKKKYRKLYRDPDNRIIGGVAAGLGAYFAVDPVIFRLAFIVLVLAGGSGLIAYLIIWIVIPEAQTTAQKLEMRGDPVTASSIGAFFREEFENVKNSFKGKK